MKHTFLILILLSNACFAARMKGFGARYYDEDTENYSEEHDTNKSLIPDIVIGGNSYVMEVSTLDDISKHTRVDINKDDQASWICLKSKGVNYWFISDNEMGGGDLTAIALAEDGSNCTPYVGELKVFVKNAPMLDASRSKLSSFFVRPEKDIVMYCKGVEKPDEYTQWNCIQYYLKGDRIQGLFISQGTAN